MSKCKLTMLCHTSCWVPRKDAITRKKILPWSFSFCIEHVCMHIRTKLPRSTYRAVSDDVASNSIRVTPIDENTAWNDQAAGINLPMSGQPLDVSEVEEAGLFKS